MDTRIASLVAAGLVLAPVAHGDQTVGLFEHAPGTFPGYTLFSALTYPETFLIDNDGLLVHSWPTTFVSGNSQYILENGDLLRCVDPGGNDVFIAGGDGGLIQQRSWDNEIVWEFTYSDSAVRHHHDIEPLPDGNVLVIAWEYRTEAEVIQAGRDPARIPDGELWPEHIIEIEPDGMGGADIVWEWHVWDHLIQDFDPTKDNYGVVSEHPERIDINFGIAGADWLHANAIDYRADFDQILLCVPFFDEIWIIDHSTTTEEAAGSTGGNAGMGGDLLYRWGNPQAYGAGTLADQKFWNQHDAGFIDPGLPGAGNVIVYNNGNGRPSGSYSTVEELVTTIDGDGAYPEPPPGGAHGPAEQLWIYDPEETFYSGALSSAGRLPNGNTLIAVGRGGDFFEIGPSLIQRGSAQAVRVWYYVMPVNADGPIRQGEKPEGNNTFRAERYAADYVGFDGRDLTPGDPIELPAIVSVEVSPSVRRNLTLFANAPNPVSRSTRIEFDLRVTSPITLDVVDVQGRRVDRLVEATLPAGPHVATWHPGDAAPGVYYYVLRSAREEVSRSLRLVR